MIEWIVVFDKDEEVVYWSWSAVNIDYSILDILYLQWWQDMAVELSCRQLEIQEQNLGGRKGNKSLGVICK